jgi:hypothetical protein
LAARKLVAAAAVVEGYMRYNAAVMVEVADLLVLAAHKPVVVLAVVGRRQRSSVDQAEAADLKVLLLSKGPLSIRMNCMQNGVDARKEIHRLLCQAQQDLCRYFAGDARFGAAYHIEWAEESWFESVQAWNLKECEE